jgi:S1-C subfamily serine protease
LNYVDVGDEVVPDLMELPLTQSMRLFGTKITADGAQRLVEQLDGVEIYRGSGGFLGVATSTFNTVVTTVTLGSAADLAGIQTDDRLTHVDGVPIRTFDDLRQELGKHGAGEQVEIRLLRGGNALHVNVSLREDPN